MNTQSRLREILTLARKLALPVLACAGFVFGMASAVKGNQPAPIAQPVAIPAQAPFPAFVAGAGIVEAASRNIQIGTPLAGIVEKVYVQVGDTVKTGAPLFRLDERAYAAEKAVRAAGLAKARADLAEAKAEQTDAATLLRLAQAVTDRRAISTEDLEKRRNALAIAKAKTDTAEAALQQAEAQLAAIETDLERLTVRAPVAGQVLQAEVRPGEFADAANLVTPLMLLGNLERLNIRVDIDEHDAWKFRRDARAVAFLRGNTRFRADLALAWVEPYVTPKRSLTGDSTERVDTRVLQVLYSFDPAQLPVYVGQQMDVYIEAPAL